MVFNIPFGQGYILIWSVRQYVSDEEQDVNHRFSAEPVDMIKDLTSTNPYVIREPILLHD